MTFKALTRRYLLLIILLAIGLSLFVTLTFEEPLSYLQQTLAGDLYIVSLIAYTVLILVAVIFAPITFAPTVPFAAKIMGSEPIFVSVMTAWFVGSLTLFLIARHKPVLLHFITDTTAQEVYEEKLPRRLDVWSLLVLRLFSPIDLLSVSVGKFKKISLMSFVTATIVGVVPLAFVLSFGTDALTDNNPTMLFVFVTLLTLIGFAYSLYNTSIFAKPKARIITHNGKFHTDELFAVATLTKVLDQSNQRYEIIRTRDDAVIDQYMQEARNPDAKHDVYVVDIGGTYEAQYDLFDHHQSRGAGSRLNDVEYASFGLVWQKYGVRLVDGNHEMVDLIDQKFVANIDAPDNGQMTYNKVHPDLAPLTLSDIVEKYYKPRGNDLDTEDFDSSFDQALKFARLTLDQVIGYYCDKYEMTARAGQLYAQATDKRVIVSPLYITASTFEEFKETQMVVCPRTDGKWQILIVREGEDMTQSRTVFPESWWGLRDEVLEQESHVQGAVFCHRSGNFMAVAETREAALEMAYKTINHQEINA